MKRTAKTKHADGSPAGGLDPALLAVIEAFAGDPQVTVGRMFGSAGLKVNGKVFAMLVKGKFVAKLPKERVEQIVASRTGEYFDPGHGRLMKDWVSLGGAAHQWVGLAKEARHLVGRGK